MTAKIEHLAGCVIPQAIPLKRERVQAVRSKPQNYDELYDFKTLFYDAFYTASRGTVTLIAPKLLNLQKIISSGTFQFDDVTVSNKRLHRALGFDRLMLRTGFRPQVMRLNWQDLELSIPVRDDGAKEFAGLNCLVTVSKNNRLQWIEDWAAYHVHRQGVEAILFFDNGSDAYSLADIAGTLSGIDGLKTFKVVSAPFRYGPNGRVKRWTKAKFLQPALLNLARLSYLRESAATLAIDIDELVQTTGGKTVFDYTTGSLLGFTRIKGRNRFAISAKQQDSIRHKDHLILSRTTGANTQSTALFQADRSGSLTGPCMASACILSAGFHFIVVWVLITSIPSPRTGELTEVGPHPGETMLKINSSADQIADMKALR